MRTLIIGASGFVGRALLETYGNDAIGTYFSHPDPNLRPLDIRDPDAVQRVLDEVQPAVVVHPAAQPHVDWCEDHIDESYAINVGGTLNVARAARQAGARFVFFSTDYVFDGAAGPYPEDAPTRPLNVYGRHKLEAEEGIAEVMDNHLIVRVCGVYGFESQGKNFVMGLLARSRAGETMKVPSDQWGSPTYGPNLAAAVRELAAGSLHGVLNVVGPDFLDRVSFARLACEALGIDAGFLRPTPTLELGQRARRPLRGGLDISRARSVLSTPLLGARDGLALMRQRLHAEGVL